MHISLGDSEWIPCAHPDRPCSLFTLLWTILFLTRPPELEASISVRLRLSNRVNTWLSLPSSLFLPAPHPSSLLQREEDRYRTQFGSSIIKEKENHVEFSKNALCSYGALKWLILHQRSRERRASAVVQKREVLGLIQPHQPPPLQTVNISLLRWRGADLLWEAASS